MLAPYNCKNCGQGFTGKYCNNCGEKVYKETDKKLLHFFSEGLHFITHFEGTLFTTVKTIFLAPGQLSLDYCNGKRKKYFKPLSFFLLLVVLYLIFPFFEGLNMQLKYHQTQPLYGKYAASKIQEISTATGWSNEVLADKFHTKGEKVSKFVLIIIVPLTALFFWAISFYKRKYLFDQMVFSAEVNAFYLLWGFFILPLLISLIFLVCRLLNIPHPVIGESIIGLLMYAVVSFYVARAAGKFYSFKWWQTTAFTSLFCIAHIFIVYVVYKFILFVVVINQLH